MTSHRRESEPHPRVDAAQPPEAGGGPGAARWRELDLLRGWAVTLMVMNHIAVGTQAVAASRLVGSLGFLGSMAPVMFFTVTGLGYGVQPATPGLRPWRRFLPKIGILLAADAFLWLSPRTWIGNDFLGFIAVSMLVLEVLRGFRRGGEVAAALVLAIVAIRFGAGVALRELLQDAPGAGWAGFVLGIQGLRGFSYPPMPWLAYPLLGYCLGRVASARREGLGRRPTRSVAALLLFAAVSGGMGFVLYARGGAVFRFGTMSAAFFMISLAFLATSLAATLIACAIPALRGAVAGASLSGIRSLAIVPLHYLYRDLLSIWGPAIDSPWSYLAGVLGGIVTSFAASGLVPPAGRALQAEQRPSAGRVALWAGVLACGWSLLAGVPASMPPWIARWTGQLLLCVLLAASMASPRPAPREGRRTAGRDLLSTAMPD